VIQQLQAVCSGPRHQANCNGSNGLVAFSSWGFAGRRLSDSPTNCHLGHELGIRDSLFASEYSLERSLERSLLSANSNFLSIQHVCLPYF